MRRAKLPQTFTVHTGRRNAKDGAPEYGVQLYYADTMPSVGEFALGGGTGQVKSLGGYVMAAGSIHQDSGEAYEVITDAPVAPLPGVVRSLKTERKPVEDDGQPITENRNIRLTSIAGKLRNAGLSHAALEAALLQVNVDRCAPPLEDAEVKEIAKHAAAWKVPEPDPIVTLGGSKVGTNGAIDGLEDADTDEEGAPRPLYPDEIWDGTPYGEFADLCSAGNYVPKKFFSEGLRAVVGAIVGDRLSCPSDGGIARAFVILISPPGIGKGTTFAWTFSRTVGTV
jgi:hypothetical protein